MDVSGPVNFLIELERAWTCVESSRPLLRKCDAETSSVHSGVVMLCCRDQLKCDGTRAETRFRLSAKVTSPFKSAGGRQFSRLLAAEVCASAVVMLDTPCSEVV